MRFTVGLVAPEDMGGSPPAALSKLCIVLSSQFACVSDETLKDVRPFINIKNTDILTAERAG